MELADPVEQLFFIRENGSVPFGAEPADVYEFERAGNRCWIRHKKGEKAYPYGVTRVMEEHPKETLDPCRTVVRRGGRSFDNVERIAVYDAHVAVRFSNGSCKRYRIGEVSLEENMLEDPRPKNVFAYLRALASTDELLNERTERPILEERYDGIGAVASGTVLSCYLSGECLGSQQDDPAPLIYPFGLNASQKKAVERAFSDRLSVVQGPPGTGKTQTILNIIANNIMQDRTTAVVSNNVSAVENVVDKLGRNDLDFVCALLGRGETKEKFFGNQPTYPDSLEAWDMASEDRERLLAEVSELVGGLGRAFKDRERLAEIDASIDAYEREYGYFKAYAESLGTGTVEQHDPRFGRASRNILRFWVREGQRVEEGRSVGFLYRAYIRAFFGGFYLDAVKRDDFLVVPLLQDAFYRAKLRELRDEARLLKERSYDFEANMATIEEKSMRAFKAQLAKRYSANRDRRTFELRGLWSRSVAFAKEYPVVLSTTHSITTSLGPGFRYDSVLMDEASQISVAAGALALACAKNAVIVGDHKQLANVVKRERADETDRIADKHRVSDCYRYAKHSMLTSVLCLWPALQPTLLKEYYRCHPQIIGFCNKMYYDGDLVIMTKDEGERDVLSFHRTVSGNHERGRRNMRQISVVCDEIIPDLVDSGVRDIGVIAPFNPQVCELKKAVPEGVSVATVHKFQGRENDAIVLSTVEDAIGSFVGDPQMVNVAVSRAVKKLRVVASQNLRGRKDNDIEELARYIEYNGFEIVQSQIRSVFDLLYKEYAEERARYLGKRPRVSRYDSENLMAAALEDMLATGRFAQVSFRCHVGLSTLVGDGVVLSPHEERYVRNPRTHVDFLFFREMNKRPLLAVEVDAWQFHKEGTKQYERDRMKDAVLERCGLPLLRLPTDSRGREYDVGAIERMLERCIAEHDEGSEEAI